MISTVGSVASSPLSSVQRVTIDVDRRRGGEASARILALLFFTTSFRARVFATQIGANRLCDGSQENVLPAIAHDWFGPDAGRPGTRFEVAFEPTGDSLRMEPVGRTTTAVKAQPWSHYMREDIPPLFGLEFNPSRWNQGFVASEDDVCLLVTLEKSGLNKDHRYEDRFLSPQRFAWQSQNRTS